MKVANSAKKFTQMHARKSLDAWLRLPRAIDLSVAQPAAVPDMTVIVVLFNQAGLSRRTLQALADQRGASFETIIVDNASEDRTPELLACVKGARVIRNSQNVGFLLAARQGAEAASGRYLAFLNSDAIAWRALANACRVMDESPDIGALGGRVVLTDGGLQEAGNRVFYDGRAGGIGRGEDPFGHAALAARATDYVSGVFLVTPAVVWRMLGGFDVAFAPAYYEDTDYCLRVWRAGLRVMYEPSVSWSIWSGAVRPVTAHHNSWSVTRTYSAAVTPLGSRSSPGHRRCRWMVTVGLRQRIGPGGRASCSLRTRCRTCPKEVVCHGPG